MELKQALGLIGLIAVAILVLIYLLKPNYQQKVISSTFLWKLSLKYKRKRIPVNRIRQLLLFICQILLLVMAVVILTRPHLLNTAELPQNEKIIVIDGSASMLAVTDDVTRFDRAIEEARELSRNTINSGGMVSIILADNDPAYATTDSGAPAARLNNIAFIEQALNNIECTFGQADIQGAMLIAEDILVNNYTAEVTLITATVYQGVEDVDIVDVSLRDANGVRTERNAAILNAEAVFREGYYVILVEIVNYNNEDGITLSIRVEDAMYNIITDKGTPQTSKIPEEIRYSIGVVCTPGEPRIVEIARFYREDTGEEYRIFEFESISLNVEIDNDTFSFDNDFNIYGGKRQSIDVLYVSDQPHDFVRHAFNVIRNELYEIWNIFIEVDYYQIIANTTGFSGYDFYIFEHSLPSELPRDGVSFLINPGRAPNNAGFDISTESAPLSKYNLSAGDAGVLGDAVEILDGLNPGSIELAKFKYVLSITDPDIQQVLGVREGDQFEPIFLVKNTPDTKFAVLSFDLHFSDLPVRIEYPLMMLNLFNYFIPTTINKNVDGRAVQSFVFDVDEDVVLKARGSNMQVTINQNNVEGELPRTLSFDTPGTYRVVQTLLDPTKIVTERFYVKISATQSNFNRIETFTEPSGDANQPGLDLILYIAAALVALIFIERILYIREGL